MLLFTRGPAYSARLAHVVCCRCCAAGLVLLAAYTPFSILYFALWGHRVWLDASWSDDKNTPGAGLPPAARAVLEAAAAAESAGPLHPRASLDMAGRPGSIAGGRHWRGTKSIDLQVGGVTL